MNPPDIKLGPLTEQQFLSLMLADEPADIDSKIQALSHEVKKAIHYDHAMASDKNLKFHLLIYLSTLIPEHPTIEERSVYHRIHDTLKAYFQKHPEYDAANVQGLLKSVHDKFDLDFEIVDSPSRPETPKATPPSPPPTPPQKYIDSTLYSDAWAAATTFYTRTLGKTNKSVLNRLNENKKVDPRFTDSIKRLLDPGKFLGRPDIHYIFESFRHTYNKDKLEFDFTTETLDSHETLIEGRVPSEVIQTYLKKYNAEKVQPRFVFMPFVYPPASSWFSFSSPHIVIMAVDFEKKKVYYYDSQGIPLSQRNYFPNFKMGEDLEKVKELCFPNDPEAKVVIGKSSHQQEKHNCGVYVAHFAQSLLEKISFEEHQSQPIPVQTIEAFRVNYAERLIDFSPSIPTIDKDKINTVFQKLQEQYQGQFVALEISPPEQALDKLRAFESKNPNKPQFLFIPIVYQIDGKEEYDLLAINYKDKENLHFNSRGLTPSPEFKIDRSIESIEKDFRKGKPECGSYLLYFAQQLLKDDSENFDYRVKDIENARSFYNSLVLP